MIEALIIGTLFYEIQPLTIRPVRLFSSTHQLIRLAMAPTGLFNGFLVYLTSVAGEAAAGSLRGANVLLAHYPSSAGGRGIGRYTWLAALKNGVFFRRLATALREVMAADTLHACHENS